MLKLAKLVSLVTLLPAAWSIPTSFRRRQNFQSQETPSRVNITTLIEEGTVAQFRQTINEVGRTDDILICGGIGDAQGGFTQSQLMNVISNSHGEEYTYLEVPDPRSSGQGTTVLYYDLCSSGEMRGVIAEARFQCDIGYTVSQLTDASSPTVAARVQMGPNGFEAVDFTKNDTPGSSITKVQCYRRYEPIQYTGQQPKSTGEAVYQFVITGKQDADRSDLCGALPAEVDDGAKFNHSSVQRFAHGQAFRPPTTPDGSGKYTLYYGDCQDVGRRYQVTHKCEIDVEPTLDGQNGQYPFASQLVEVKSESDVELGQVEGQVGANVQGHGCSKLDSPVQAYTARSKAPQPSATAD